MLVGTLLIAPAQGGHAADDAPETAPSSTTTTVPPSISVTDAPARVEEVHATLDRIEMLASVPRNLAGIEEKLPTFSRDIAKRLARDRALIASGDLFDVDSIVQRWADERALLGRWDEALERRGRDLANLLGEVGDLQNVWTRTQSLLREANAPPELLTRVRETLARIDGTRAKVESQRDASLTLRNHVARKQAAVRALVADADIMQRRLFTSIFVQDQPPLWRVWGTRQSTPLGVRLRSTLERDQDDFADFLRASAASRVAVAFAALIGLIIFSLGLARRAKRWPNDDVAPGRISLVVERPISTGLVLWVLLLPWLQVPTGVRRAAGLLLVVPIVRLLGPLLGSTAVAASAYLVAILVLDRLGGALGIVPELARPIFLAEMIVGYAGAEWVRRLTSAHPLPPGTVVHRHARALARVLQIGLVIAIVADVLGFGQLARLLGNGTVISGCAAVATWVTKRALDGLVSVLVRSWPLGSLRLVRRDPREAARHVRRIIGWILVALYGLAVLQLFRVLGVTVDAARTTLDVTLAVGEVQISIGDVCTFVLGIYLAFTLSKGLRRVLEVEILPRAVLPRGVPYAISTASGYGILLVGVVVAFAAAGFEVGRITIILGALGVGIGFGLQEIVRDFVAGAVLLFERPIQIGDVVQVSDVFGDVNRIGLRSSTIRTYEGAEIILPNSTLTSSQITNWTLSDRKRRIDIVVGVAYGSDPTRVIALLDETARSHPDLLDRPEPSVLFTGFGESSLDFQLRAWTDRSDQFMQVRSNVGVAVHDALAGAGITIPFPQRDIHVRSS